MKQHVIFSAYRKERSEEENHENHMQAVRVLSKAGIEHAEIGGFYDGVNEESILVDAHYINIVFALCETYKQDSYMLLDNVERNNWRQAHIATFNRNYTAAELQYIGYLHPIKPEQRQYFDAWSYRKDLDQYYAVSPVEASSMAQYAGMNQ